MHSPTILNSANISTHFSLFSALYSYNNPIFHHYPLYAQDPRTHIFGFSFICTILRSGRHLIYDECVPESRYRPDRSYRRYLLYLRCYPDPWTSDRWTTKRPDLPQEYIDRRVDIRARRDEYDRRVLISTLIPSSRVKLFSHHREWELVQHDDTISYRVGSQSNNRSTECLCGYSSCFLTDSCSISLDRIRYLGNVDDRTRQKNYQNTRQNPLTRRSPTPILSS